MTGVLPIIRKNNGCDYHRVYLPMKYLGYDFKEFMEGGKVRTFDGVQIILFNRLPLDPIEQIIFNKNRHGIKMVLDLDDWWELNSNHLLYASFKKSKMAEKIITLIKNADHVICTTSRLADKIRPYTDAISVIPNALPFGDDQFTEHRNPDNMTRFIYAGGSTHQWDLRILTNPFKKLIAERLDTEAKFALAGYSDVTQASKAVWNDMERKFTVFDSLRNYSRKYGLPVDEYMKLYENSDVSLVPLEDNIFTPFKSNLKILEAGCKNMPVIVSDVPPYSDEANKDVLMTARNTREWYDNLRFCIKNPNFVKEKGLELGEYVRKNYDLRKVNVWRQQLFDYLKTK